MAVRLARIGVRSFDLPLSRPLRVGGRTLSRRAGLLVVAEDGEGHAGLGETAPLPALHPESREAAESQLLALAPHLEGAAVPDGCSELEGAFQAWLGGRHLHRSVRAGVEGAVLSLLADRAGLPLARLLDAGAAGSVRINGLLDGEPAAVVDEAGRLAGEGYAALKIKVGRGDPLAEAALVGAVRERVGAGVELRLDANRAWDLPTALAFAKSVAAAQVAYIEEPLRDLLDLPAYLRRARLALALDETLLVFSPDAPPPLHGVAALILKPSVLGGYERAAGWVRLARREGLAAVVSAAFPTAVGLGLDTAFAAAFVPGGVHGLGTSGALAADLATAPLPLSHGRIDAARLPRRPGDFALESTRELR